MKNNSRETGKSGERIAAEYLKSKGYLIHTMNYGCRYGEIDVVAEKDGVLAFVEVKTRSHTDYGRPADYVNYAKRRRIVSAAEFYLMYNDLGLEPRFDVIEVLVKDDDVRPRYFIHHIEDAFSAGE